MPKSSPTNAVNIAARGIQKNTGIAKLLFNQAEAKAPKPKKTACPTDIWPVKPTNIFNPKAAIA